jgi:MFS family permease
MKSGRGFGSILEMMEPLEQSPTIPPPVPFKNRRPWLIVFGIFEVLIALAFLGLGLMMLLLPQEALKQAQAQQQPGTPQISMLPVAMMYAALASAWLVTGIGTILAKNWARIVSLVLSYFWLVTGVIGILVSGVILPAILKQQSHGSADSSAVALLFVLGFMTLLMVLLPGVFLLFFHNNDVRATCLSGYESAETQRPVLMNVLISLFALSVLCGPFSLFSPYPAVVFAIPIWGLPGKLILLVSLSAEAVALWGFVKADIRGWWVAMFSSAFWIASSSALFFRHDSLITLYEKMGMNTQAMKSMQGAFAVGGVFVIIMVVGRLVAIIYSRRYFPSDAPFPQGDTVV